MKNLYSIAEICAQHGIQRAVLSPGSRVAPLNIGFGKHPKIDTTIVSDERSAGYVALGMSLQTELPVTLCCTSGTAAINYGPAIAEAYYQQIPLIVLTADRPPEWTDQADGQTIRQQGLHGLHVKKSFQLPTDLAHEDAQWHAGRIINEAIIAAQALPKGPVHINVPIREPFYPENDDAVTFDAGKIIQPVSAEPVLSNKQYFMLNKYMKLYERVLIIAGQGVYSTELLKELALENLPVVADIMANVHRHDNMINHHDLFLGKLVKEKNDHLAPELVISFGGAVLSKPLKQYLRMFTPEEHWHIQKSGMPPDVYQSLTKVIHARPEDFFKNMTYEADEPQFLADWLYEEHRSKLYLQKFIESAPFGEFKAIQMVLEALPEQSVLHLGNSMPVRYANLLPLAQSQHVTVFANRGTSGIDGSLSTFIGSARMSEKLHLILLGDMSFAYDKNALWATDLPSNIRIVVLNNHGGGIFKMIDGPSRVKEVDELFVTEQPYTAKPASLEAGLTYAEIRETKELQDQLTSFFDPNDSGKVLEVFSEVEHNTTIFKKLKQMEGYGS